MKNKILILFEIILALPLVSAATFYPVLDLYHMFVEQVFGSVIAAGVGLAFLFALVCVIGRVSYGSIIFLVGTFIMVYFMGFLGALAAVPIFIGSFIYFVSGILNLINSYR